MSELQTETQNIDVTPSRRMVCQQCRELIRNRRYNIIERRNLHEVSPVLYVLLNLFQFDAMCWTSLGFPRALQSFRSEAHAA